MSTNDYEIAGSDELEALGRDDVAFDTSAGLQPGDHVDERQYEAEPKSSSKSRACVIVVVIFFVLAVTGIILGVLLSRSGGSGGPDSNAAGGPTTGPSTPKPTAIGVTTPPSTKAPTTAAMTSGSNAVRKYTINVLERLPHDTAAFTQGFEYANGVFYESTGLEGKSTLRQVEMKTGRVLQKYHFPDMTLFGEGLTLHKDHHIFMITWRAGRGFVFNQSSFEVIKEWKYEGEGWGLCMDREKDEVYMSDGTTELRVLDPEDLSEKRRVTVTLKGERVEDLNEIEWICGEVWSNVWQTKKIYRIDPTSGRVKAIIDASNLPQHGDRRQSNDVLNGIAFDRATGRLWLTGKLWPAVYRVSVNDDSLDLTKCK